MDIQELQSPDDYMPTSSVRYNVLRVETHSEGWQVQSAEVQWDASGSESITPSQQQVLDAHRLDHLKLLWQSQGYILVARHKSEAAEVLFYEHHADRQRLAKDER
ncbi:MAG: hypothetical protein ABI700_26340 [Chloroflexota bacterium]